MFFKMENKIYTIGDCQYTIDPEFGLWYDPRTNGPVLYLRWIVKDEKGKCSYFGRTIGPVNSLTQSVIDKVMAEVKAELKEAGINLFKVKTPQSFSSIYPDIQLPSYIRETVSKDKKFLCVRFVKNGIAAANRRKVNGLSKIKYQQVLTDLIMLAENLTQLGIKVYNLNYDKHVLHSEKRKVTVKGGVRCLTDYPDVVLPVGVYELTRNKTLFCKFDMHGDLQVLSWGITNKTKEQIVSLLKEIVEFQEVLKFHGHTVYGVDKTFGLRAMIKCPDIQIPCWIKELNNGETMRFKYVNEKGVGRWKSCSLYKMDKQQIINALSYLYEQAQHLTEHGWKIYGRI